MFDWNDEELANIIWDEVGETEDHIVPYPEGNEDRAPALYRDHIKKEWNQEATNEKPPLQNKSVNKNDLAGDKQESASQYDSAEGTSTGGSRMEPWPDLSLPPAAKTYQDSMGTEVSKNVTEITRFDSSKGDVTSKLDEGTSILQIQHEDGEQSDFVCYGWDNIESFDDLDRIFSDDEEIFGHVSLGNDDRPWSSSKEATCTAQRSFQLCMDSTSWDLGTSESMSGHLKIKTEYAQDQDQSSTQGFGKMSYLSSHAQKNVHASAHRVDFTGGNREVVAKEKTELERLGKTLAFDSLLVGKNVTCSNELTDKVSSKEKLSETRKKSWGGHGGQHLPDSCGIWSPHANQMQQFGVPQTCSGSVLSDQTQFQTCSSSVAPSVHGNIRNQYPTMTRLPHTHFREEKKPVLSGYEVCTSTTNPLSRFPVTFAKPLTMTPQEKIEKLRRRQQMQALLAIKRQQQQFSHQVSISDHSVAQKCHGYQIQMMQGGNTEVEENGSTLLLIDLKSPIEHDDSNTTPILVDDCYSVAAITLYRLQDVIAKLDIQGRLCIRDSLLRLAQSVMQRHYAGDTSSTDKSNRDELEVPKEETSSHNSFTQIPDVETQTNRIDRAVAHLLFHRPELSRKHPWTPESPSSIKLPCEKNANGLLSSPRGLLPNRCRRKQNPHLSAEEQSKKKICIAASGNAANEALDAGDMGIGAPGHQ